MEIGCSKTQATLFSLSTVKGKAMLKLEDMPVPHVDNPTFLGVILDTRLTWKTHLEAVAARSVRKLGLLKKLAGTTWGADTNILYRSCPSHHRLCHNLLGHRFKCQQEQAGQK